MSPTALRVPFVVVAALAQLAVWLVVRPDRAGAQWTDGTSVEVWLGLMALLAVAIGVLAPDRQAVVVTVVVGWLSQVVHFAVLGEHYDGTLSGVGALLQVFFGAVAVGLALLARRLSGPDRP